MLAMASPFVVERTFCVRGPSSEAPVPIPAILVDGRWAVPLGAFDNWLNIAIVGHWRAAHDAIAAWLTMASQALGGSPESSAELRPETTPPPQSDAVVKGRSALGLDADSDEEVLEASAGDGTGASAGGGARALPEWRTVAVDGQEYLLRRGRGRRIMIPLEGEDLPRLLSVLHGMVDLGPDLPVTPFRKRPSGSDLASDPMDAGRIRWNDRLASWLVRFQDEKGNRRQVTKGLAPPTTGLSGDDLPDSEAAELRQAFLVRARRRWNELDRSKAPRYIGAAVAEGDKGQIVTPQKRPRVT